MLALFGEDERWALQLGGGDDYELCFTASDVQADVLIENLARTGGGVTCIGRIVEEAGVHCVDAAGNAVILARRGWNHFAS
jgi:thiamine-monophosphate kinase